MNIGILILLALVQGFAELLPVSSSAHVILAQNLLGLDPSSPEMSFLLVMLHTGTMFAVLIYFWQRWAAYFRDRATAKNFIKKILIATLATGVLGLALKVLIEKLILEKFMGYEKGEIEQLFRMLPLLSACLAVAGVLIIIAGLKQATRTHDLSSRDSLWIGLVQGLVLPFRGLSRSGMTISTALLRSVDRRKAEEFSFALAVVLTPAVVMRELQRFLHAQSGGSQSVPQLLLPGLLGMVFSFASGWLALRWLSSWLEKGRWYLFGIYCLLFAIVVALRSFFLT